MKKVMEVIKRHYFECEKGNRWSQCEWSNTANNNNQLRKDGDMCFFSGCKENDHKIKLVKSLDNDDPEKFNWFKNIYQD